MLNPLKNPLVLKTILDKAQQELNAAVVYRKMQFKDNSLYLRIELDNTTQHPYFYLRNEKGDILAQMTATELFQDPSIQLQLKRIPSFARSFIKIDKIIPKIDQRIKNYLADNQFFKVEEGAKTANIELWNQDTILKKGMKLTEIFT